MTRAHDMGGRFGDGPVVPEPETLKFEKDWHARAMALTLAAGALGQWNIDVSRHARERLRPKDYARFSYYEKWMAGLADLLVEKGVVTREELNGAAPEPSPLAARKLQAAQVAGMLSAGGPADRPSDVAQQFLAGDWVVTRRISENNYAPGGHTRLPAYAAGAKGQILRCHGSHVLPDKSAHGMGEGPEPLYTVVFAATELWAHPEHPDDEVTLDLWQSYLTRTP